MNLEHGCWVVVADGGKFLLLRNNGDDELLDLKVEQHAHQANPSTQAQGADRPGRFEDAGVGRSAVQQTDWHRIAKEEFAKHLSDRLRDWALKRRFEQLVLVADPRTLGELREALHSEVRARVVGELPKDLTNHPLDEIERAIAEA